MLRWFLIFCILHCHQILSVLASDAATFKAADEAPLTIDSSNGLQCDRVKQVCTAEGNVVVRKGPYEMFAKKGLAYMRKNEEGKTEIYRVEAYEDVKFFGLNGEAATSDEAYFDMDEKVIRLIPLKNRQVRAWKDEYVLFANDLAIHLQPDQDNKLNVKHIDADGNVTLSSEEELVSGDHAIYTPESRMVHITGDVRLNRKEGQLRGTYAEVNIDTKLSKVLKRPDVESDKRVRVFVYPEKVKSSPLGSTVKQE